MNPDLDTPYTMSYSLSLQRELPYGIFAEAAYVANLGRHLIRQPDIISPRLNSFAPTCRRAERQRQRAATI